MELPSGENRTSGVKPALFAPVTLAVVLVWACGGNVAAPISQQADSIEDAAPQPPPDAHVSFNFDAATPVQSASPDATVPVEDASAPLADAGPPSADAGSPAPDSGSPSGDSGAPSTPPVDATAPPPPPPPPPSTDASSSDDASAFADVGLDDAGPGNGGPGVDSGSALDGGTMTCADDGNDCSSDSECCTGLCLSFGSCGACIAVAGLCLTDSDCCDGQCNLQTNSCM
jgi:hypothetical protein